MSLNPDVVPGYRRDIQEKIMARRSPSVTDFESLGLDFETTISEVRKMPFALRPQDVGIIY